MSSPLSDVDRFARLLHGRHAAVLIQTSEEQHAAGIVREAASRLRRRIMQWTAVKGAYEGFAVTSARKDSEHPAAALYHFAQEARRETVAIIFDLAGHAQQDARTLRAWRELVQRMQQEGGTVVLIEHAESIPSIIREEATLFDISLPEADEIQNIARSTLRSMKRDHPDVEVAITRSDFDLIVKNLAGLSRRQCEQIIRDTVIIDHTFDRDDLNHVLAEKRKLLHEGGLLEYVESPASLDDIGGLVHLKKWLAARSRSFDDKAASFGLTPPRGVLMLGVQGAGKSLCAKAIATGWKRPLLRMDPGALYDRYVGESERRLRECLRQAELMAPIVLWIDEIEKGFASAASQSTDGGLSQRMFGTLLTWMQEHTAPVFLVATANNIDALPPELLRKGRFDAVFFVDLPDAEVRKQIFAIHLRKRDRDVNAIDLDQLAQASSGYSGAEIEQSVLSAMHDSFASGGPLDTAMICAALEHSPPLSVTMREKLAILPQWAVGRCTPAG
ncbi:MAG: AAA family ATPase [Phycisphaerales bacterium]